MTDLILTGERIALRALEREDAVALARHVTAETETAMGGRRVPVSPIAFERWIEGLTGAIPPREISFAVCLVGATDPGDLIGTATLRDIDWVNRTAETGMGLHPAANRGRGLGTEAKHLVLAYAFERLHLHALRATVWEPNTRSAAALLRQGYREAGRARWSHPQDGTYRETRYFDLLRPEWEAAHREWRANRAALRADATGSARSDSATTGNAG